MTTTRRWTTGLIAAMAWCGALVVGRPVQAQVGHTPETSPYKDLEHSQELTGFLGILRSQKDPAGVAYRGGPMIGTRYELHIGGPAYLVGRVAAAHSERTVIDPTRAADTRVRGKLTGWLLFSDIGLALSLTGHKSWHDLSPTLNGGLGLVTDFRNTDVGGYRFGTPFALTYGSGIRWTPGGRLQARLDVTDYLFRIAYPERFFRPTETVPAFLPANEARSRWTHNGAFTVGLSYLFGR